MVAKFTTCGTLYRVHRGGNKAMTFGNMLRKERQLTETTLGALARHLGVSVTYLSDVEPGTPRLEWGLRITLGLEH